MKTHLSSGGFLFYKDIISGEIYVALLKDKKGKFLIPKGHTEGTESPENTAKREISEEIGIDNNKIKIIQKIGEESYGWNDGVDDHKKTVYIFMAEVDKKEDIISQNEGDVIEAGWYKVYEAISLITYNKEFLKDAFQNYVYGKADTNSNSCKKLIIAIPTYNGGDSLRSTVNNIFDEIETVKNIYDCSVHLCIDHSNDNTLTIAKELELEYSNFAYSFNDHLQGKTNTLNYIYKNTKSDFFFILDDDVTLKKGSLKAMTSELLLEKSILVFSDWCRVKYTGRSFTKKFWNYILGVKFDIQPYDKKSEIARGAFMGMLTKNYVYLPESTAFNEDQFLQYLYWPKTAEVEESVLYFHSVNSVYDYYKRFVRILNGDNLLKNYFTKERIDRCETDLFRKVDYLKVLKRPPKESSSFLFYRFIRFFIKKMALNSVKNNKKDEWFRFKVK